MVKFPNKLPFGQRFYMQSLKTCWSNGNLIRSKPSYRRPELEYQNPALMFSSSSHVAVMHGIFRQGHSRSSIWEDFLHCKMAGICFREYLWLQTAHLEGRRSSKVVGKGEPPAQWHNKVSWGQVMEAKPGIKHSPAGDPLTRTKVLYI